MLWGKKKYQNFYGSGSFILSYSFFDTEKLRVLSLLTSILIDKHSNMFAAIDNLPLAFFFTSALLFSFLKKANDYLSLLFMSSVFVIVLVKLLGR